MTIEYYTLVLIVCKCISEENCGDAMYKVGYMTRNGAVYFSENIYPHIEEAIKNGTEYAKNKIGSMCKNVYTQYVNGYQNDNAQYINTYQNNDDDQLFPSTSVIVNGEEFVLTS